MMKIEACTHLFWNNGRVGWQNVVGLSRIGLCLKWLDELPLEDKELTERPRFNLVSRTETVSLAFSKLWTRSPRWSVILLSSWTAPMPSARWKKYIMQPRFWTSHFKRHFLLVVKNWMLLFSLGQRGTMHCIYKAMQNWIKLFFCNRLSSFE